MSEPILRPDAPDYPPLLHALEPAPELFLQGAPPPAHALAIVGSRSPSPYGRRMARRLGRQAAEAGLAVISGLARGIDTEAHEGCLERGGRTWAVLGCGIDRVYPPENERLARRLQDGGGGLLSEYPPGTAPRPGYFLARNRIVAGLSWAVIVVEGRERSGALSTARQALELGRELFAVPGPADSPLSAAPHALLRQGAGLACGLEDVLPGLPPECRLRSLYKEGGPVRELQLGGERRKIIELLDTEALTLEELGAATGLDAPRLSAIIFDLELQNLIFAVPGQRYAKKGR